MWIPWALTCASLNAVTSALTKRAAELGGAVAVTFWVFVLSVPLAAALLAIDGVPPVEPGFWPALAIGVTANIAALTLRNLGLKLAPLSVAVPLLSFTPVFLLGTEALVLGDLPSARGVAGVLAIVAGAYTLNLDAARGGVLHPVRVVVRDRGCQCMLAVAFLWSLTSVIDKWCVVRSSPAFYLATFHAGFVLGYLPLAAVWRRGVTLRRPRHWRRYALIALIHFGSILAQMIAIQLVLVSYVIAIKRSGMLLSVLIGAVYFGERGVRQRLAGAACMAVGVALILTA
ncbi:MAG: DMT family transporter [Candidatus Eiseniibacteriota bacterium]|jgi:drug/metabolite transporter (DMT)-like permease